MGVEPTSPVDQPSVGAQGWHLCRSAKGTLAEGEGVEPPRLALDCFQDSCRRQSACPPIEAAVAGVEPAIVSLTGSRLTVRPHRNESVRAAGFEPAFSCARGRRNPRLSHALIAKSTQRESNPHIRHGKAAGSRYIMGAKNRTKLSKIESTGWDSNPRPARECSARITGAHFLAARATSAYLSVGSEGLEPSPTWVRTRHAAANTLIPCISFTPTQNRRGGNRTLGLVLIRDLLSPLSYAPAVGPKGLEPLLAGLKVRCAAVTPRPRNVGRAYAFESCRFHVGSPRFQW